MYQEYLFNNPDINKIKDLLSINYIEIVRAEEYMNKLVEWQNNADISIQEHILRGEEHILQKEFIKKTPKIIQNQSVSEDKFKNMRVLHNCIKSYLYSEYANKVNLLLEIAVGKGGDHHKWIRYDVGHVDGYDLNEKSLAEADKRFKGNKKNKNKENPTTFTTHHLDLSVNVIPTHEPLYDVVSSQFSIHYFFKNDETFKVVMDSISNNLKVGGYFIGTMFDGKAVQEYIGGHDKDDEKYFSISKTGNNKDFFGNEITVKIHENVSSSNVLSDESREYLVDFEEFTKIIKDQYNFELVESDLFSDVILQEMNISCERLSPLSEHEKHFSYLNRTFVFQKIDKNSMDIE
jgi:hypothetical protein